MLGKWPGASKKGWVECSIKDQGLSQTGHWTSQQDPECCLGHRQVGRQVWWWNRRKFPAVSVSLPNGIYEEKHLLLVEGRNRGKKRCWRFEERWSKGMDSE